MECEHKSMSPMIETRIKERTGREYRAGIWYCNTWGCGYKEDRPYVPIMFSEDGDYGEADDIRVLNILSSYLNLTHKETLEKLKEATIDNPIEYQGEAKFWTEKN